MNEEKIAFAKKQLADSCVWARFIQAYPDLWYGVFHDGSVTVMMDKNNYCRVSDDSVIRRLHYIIHTHEKYYFCPGVSELRGGIEYEEIDAALLEIEKHHLKWMQDEKI